MTKWRAALAAILMCGTLLVVAAAGLVVAVWAGRDWLVWPGLAVGVVACFAVGRAYVGRFDDPYVYGRPPGTIDPESRAYLVEDGERP